MLSEKITPASHAGEDQSSAAPGPAEFADRSAHWNKVQVGLAAVARRQGWSTTQEDFDSETLSNLIIANDWLNAGDIVYSADNRAIALRDLISADDIIPILRDRAKALVGEEMAAGYPDVSDLHKGILNGALRAWIALCCAPEFFGVENIQPHKLSDLDLDAAASVVIGSEQ